MKKIILILTFLIGIVFIQNSVAVITATTNYIGSFSGSITFTCTGTQNVSTNFKLSNKAFTKNRIAPQFYTITLMSNSGWENTNYSPYNVNIAVVGKSNVKIFIKKMTQNKTTLPVALFKFCYMLPHSLIK